ncbi:MAG: hypothetical protein ACI4HQ_05665 [Acetatifactor sp.]
MTIHRYSVFGWSKQIMFYLSLVKTLGVSFDAIFELASEQVEVELREIAGLYRACPEQGRQLTLAAVRALTHEMMDESSKI